MNISNIINNLSVSTQKFYDSVSEFNKDKKKVASAYEKCMIALKTLDDAIKDKTDAPKQYNHLTKEYYFEILFSHKLWRTAVYYKKEIRSSYKSEALINLLELSCLFGGMSFLNTDFITASMCFSSIPILACFQTKVRSERHKKLKSNENIYELIKSSEDNAKELEEKIKNLLK